MVFLLALVVAEASLETIPREIWGYPLIKRQSQRLKKKPEFMLLDKSLVPKGFISHGGAMNILNNNKPEDIYILCLLRLHS